MNPLCVKSAQFCSCKQLLLLILSSVTPKKNLIYLNMEGNKLGKKTAGTGEAVGRGIKCNRNYFVIPSSSAMPLYFFMWETKKKNPLQMVTAAMKLKTLTPWKESYDQPG